MVTIVVPPVAPVSSNWWVCPPKILLPCPLRPSTFVPFADYDVSFKFPVASSQVASQEPNCCPEPTGTPDPVPEPWQLPPPAVWPALIISPPSDPPVVAAKYTLLMLSNTNDSPTIVPLTLDGGVLVPGVQTQLSGYSSWYAVFGNPVTKVAAVIAAEPPLVVPFKYTDPKLGMAARTSDYVVGTQSFDGKYSPDGQILAICTQAAPYMNFYSVADGDLTHIPMVTNLLTYRSMWWSPDSKYMIVLALTPRVYKRVGNVITDITVTAGITSTTAEYYRGAFTPNGTYVVIPGYDQNFNATLVVYLNNQDDTFTFVREVLLIGSPTIRDMCFSADGLLLFMATDSSSERIAVYAHDGAGSFDWMGPINQPPLGGQAMAVAITPDDKAVAISCTAPPYLHIWNVNKAVFPQDWTKVPLPAGISISGNGRELTWL